MDDNNNKNQPGQTASDYQKILDEYAASIKPETTSDTVAPDEVTTVKLDEVKDTANEKAFLKDINNPQLESPVHPSLAANLEADDDYPQMPSNEPEKIPLINPPKNDFVSPTPPTPVQEPVKTPEQIKSEIDKILATDTTPDQPFDDAHQSPRLNIFKILFIISLITFLGVAGVLAYTLFLNPSTSDKKVDSNQQSTVTPTSTVSSGSCELNGSVYQIGESFASADGCNTCSCQSADVITCTEKACSITPEVIPATKSASITPIKTTISPTKPATSSTKISPTTKLSNPAIGE